MVQIYPTGAGIGTRHAVAEKALQVGRDNDCDIRIDDHSISRHHARIEPGADGHYVIDQNSTNGTFVNDQPASMSKLKDGDYLRVGNRIFRYLVGGNVEADYHEEIYRLTIIDGLTQIYNQRYLLEFLDRELARCARYGRPLSLVLFDIDRFKAINDEFGHLGGDHTLRDLANCLKKAVRREELLARYGGEEFTIVLVETSQEGAMEMAERLREIVEKYPFEYEGKKYQLTISLGVVSTAGGEVVSPKDLIQKADEKLYEAKNSGRNRVVG